MPVSRRLAADVSWLWAGYVGRSLAYLGVTVVLTHSLGPDGFGELSLFMAFGLGVASLAGSWPFLAIPILVGKGSRVGDVFPPAARLAAAGTLVFLVAALPLAWAILSHEPEVLVLLAIYSCALVSFQGLYGVFQAQGRMPAIAGVQTGERTTTLVLLAALLAASSVTVHSAQLTLAASGLAASTLGYALLVDRRDLRGGGEVLHWRTVFQTVGAMGIVTASSYAVAWVDIYLLAAFKPDSDVGIYSLAYQVYTFVLQLASLWIVATLPRHARSLHGGSSIAEEMPREKVLMGLRLWSALVGLGAVAAALLLADVFGSGFADSATPLMLLLAGASFLAPYLAAVSVLIAAGESALIARVSLACAALNIVVDLILIPTVGLVGPAIATTLQAAAGGAWLLGRALGAKRLLELGRASAPVFLTVAALAADPSSPPLLALTGAAAALTALPALRWLRQNPIALRASPPSIPG